MAPHPPQPHHGLDTVQRELRAPKAAGVAGLLFAALFVAAIVLIGSGPGTDATTAEVTDWFRQEQHRVAIVGLYLAPFAGITFLWFIAVIRNRIGEMEDRFFATAFLGSGLLFIAMLFASAATAGAPIAAVEFQGAPPPTPEVLTLERGLAYTFLFVYGIRAAAVFMLVVSTIGLKTGALPRWLVVMGYALAVIMLVSVSFFRLLVLAFPLWVAAVSVVILASDWRGATRVPTGPGPPAE